MLCALMMAPDGVRQFASPHPTPSLQVAMFVMTAVQGLTLLVTRWNERVQLVGYSAILLAFSGWTWSAGATYDVVVLTSIGLFSALGVLWLGRQGRRSTQAHME